MEVVPILSFLRRYVLLVALLLAVTGLHAQEPRYVLRSGQMQIELPKDMQRETLEQFIKKYNLNGIGLHSLFLGGYYDSLKALGWSLFESNGKTLVLRKPLQDFVPGTQVPEILGTADLLGISDIKYGRNLLKHPAAIQVKDSVVRFLLPGFTKARKVILAGSFNNWSEESLPLQRTDTGWVAELKLPKGKYTYKYIVDGRWMTDPQNEVRANDGEGNVNSVLFVTNARFVLNGYADARRVFVAGSFNNWRPSELAMQKIGSVWVLPLYLGEGTHTYKFVADGHWLHDPNNSSILPDGHGGYNSVMKNGTPRLFKLDGYYNAKSVLLTGSFNGWREDELSFQRVITGWELYHTLGPGNHSYSIIVDGKRIADPLNPLQVQDDRGRNSRSFLIVAPNHSFRLEGYGAARSVYLAGDFNEWHPKAFAMKREGNAWVFPVHLAPGKHRYKFIVDGEWILDPANKLWEQNEYRTKNSILWKQ